MGIPLRIFRRSFSLTTSFLLPTRVRDALTAIPSPSCFLHSPPCLARPIHPSNEISSRRPEMLMKMEAPSSTFSVQADPGRRYRDYLLALEDERRKIHVFQRELPLSLHLVTHTIEAMKSQMDPVLSSEETTVSDHGPVLEEFIPLNPSLSLCSSDQEESTHAVPPVSDAEPETDKAMPAWLQSVQLRTEPPHQSPSHNNMELPCKPMALNATKAGGAFRPFDKENRPVVELPASSTTAAASSAVVADRGYESDTEVEVHDKDSKDTSDTEVVVVHDKHKEGQSQPNRKPRRCWAPELHRRFLQALQQLGGFHVATPKQIREFMKVDGLTNDEVKSHLQKYRLHTSRRTSSTTLSSGPAATQPATQIVLVGNCFWVPSHEYATVAAAAVTATTSPPQVKLTNIVNQVYAPVAMLPADLKPRLHEQSSRQSEVRRRSDTGDVSSDTPTTSSLSQTASA